MHSALKRLTILLALAGERLILHVHVSRPLLLSVYAIAFGAFIAGIGDLEFDLGGYIFAGMSCLVQAAFLVLLKKAHISQSISNTGLVYYNALLSLPFVAGVAYFGGDIQEALAFPKWSDSGFQVRTLAELRLP